MIKTLAKRLIRCTGFNLVRCSWRLPPESFPPDYDADAVEIIRAVKPFTMTSSERIFALIQAVRYVVQADLPGSMVECGVWRGGSMMAVAHALQRLGKADRDLYLLDTYEGMTEPTAVDVSIRGEPASIPFERTRTATGASNWCYASVEEVRDNLFSTGYDRDRLRFIKGKVEDTIPASAPQEIAILRLDTDWYESTKHEMLHLFPRLAVGGVLIIDDYGRWQGSTKAVDEYLAEKNITLLLNRVDEGRIAVKP